MRKYFAGEYLLGEFHTIPLKTGNFNRMKPPFSGTGKKANRHIKQG